MEDLPNIHELLLFGLGCLSVLSILGTAILFGIGLLGELLDDWLHASRSDWGHPPLWKTSLADAVMIVSRVAGLIVVMGAAVVTPAYLSALFVSG